MKLDGSAGTKSKLAPEVQDLVKMMFDVEQMKKTMVEFEVNKQSKTKLIQSKNNNFDFKL